MPLTVISSTIDGSPGPHFINCLWLGANICILDLSLPFRFCRHPGMHNKPTFRITADGFVHRRRLDRYDNLGHIGSILHPMNGSHVATQVRVWWNALLASDEPIEEYVPPAKRIMSVTIRVRPSALVVS